MRNIIPAALLAVVMATACATTQAHVATGGTVTKRTVVSWVCPAGKRPDPKNISPNCELAAPMPEAQAKEEHRPPVIAMEKRVEFATNSAALDDAAKATLGSVVQGLQSDPRVITIRVVGHADNTGDTENNEKLSAERADAVKQYLEQQGVPAQKLQTRALGDTAPVASNESADGRAINRSAAVIALQPATKGGVTPGGAAHGE